MKVNCLDTGVRDLAIGALSVLLACLSNSTAGDWPCFRADPDRTGVTSETVRMPLRLAWQYEANHPPSPAFRGGLASFGRWRHVEPITHDYVFEPIVADGKVYFGSSTEETVVCLDATSGKPAWVFYTEGPVRLAPRYERGRIYVGSDDGYVYCLDAKQGELVWKFQAAPRDSRSIGNGRLISAWPVRTSIAVADGAAYFGAGLLPTLGTYLYSVDVDRGELLWKRQVPYSPHGGILVDGDTLLVATGRTAPAEFDRSDGKPLIEQPGPRRALGSSFVGKLNDMVVWGPDESGVMFFRVSEEPIRGRKSQDAGATVTGRVTGLKAHSTIAGEMLYTICDEQVLAVGWEAFHSAASENVKIKRRPWEKEASVRYDARPYGLGRAGQPVFEDHILLRQLQQNKAWAVPNDDGLVTAILAGTSLICGGQNKVVIFNAHTGKQLWTHTLDGEARGLAVAGGALYVSTSQGRLYCFQHDFHGRPAIRKPRLADPYRPDAVVADAAKTVLRQTGTRKGFCLVLGAGTGQLTYEIARQSDFFVVVLDKDRRLVDAARKKLTAAGVYGKRVVVHHVHQSDPPYPEYFANLIVCQERLQSGGLPYRARAVLRLLQPYGGTILLGQQQGCTWPAEWKVEGLSDWKPLGESGFRWHVARREGLPGAGEWTHMYADPANTVCSGDQLVGPDLTLQWFGPPGAKDVVERHSVAMPPLFKNGKMFIAGMYETVRAVDPYNGAELWKVKVPESTRMMMSHNAGFMAAADDGLFVAADSTCWMLDFNTGRLLHKFAGLNEQSDWGYVGTTGNYLLGSNQKPSADEYSSGRRRPGHRFLVQARDLHSRPTVSENLFTYNYPNRTLVWKYEGGSAILNPTITVGGDRIYFAESRSPKVLADTSGTAQLPDFFVTGAQLVALDVHTGKTCWTKALGPISQKPEDEHEHIMFLSFADGTLVSTRTGHVDQKLTYLIEALDAATGEPKWSHRLQSKHRVYAPLTYGKNGQQAHPAIASGRIYLLSHITDALISLDLKTGRCRRDPDMYNFWIQSKTCAVPTASATGLYFRRNSCYMLDIPSGQLRDMTGVTRPGCWMSIIPAGGLVLMPEASSGCTCGFALQTSVVLRSRRAHP